MGQSTTGSQHRSSAGGMPAPVNMKSGAGDITTEGRALERMRQLADGGNLEEAIHVAKQVITCNNVDTATQVIIMKQVVDWHGHLGQADYARRSASKAVTLARRDLGACHPLSLLVRHSELYWMCMSGYDEAAQPQFEPLIKDICRTLGHTDSLAWAARTNSAMPYKKRRDYAGAALIYRQLADDMGAELDPDDPMLLTIRDNLAEVLALDEQWDAAIALYEELVKDVIPVWGQGSELTLSIRDSLAACLFASGDVEKARQLWSVLTQDCRRFLGERADMTARQRILQVALALDEDDYSAAQHWCTELLENLPAGFTEEDVQIYMHIQGSCQEAVDTQEGIRQR